MSSNWHGWLIRRRQHLISSAATSSTSIATISAVTSSVLRVSSSMTMTSSGSATVVSSSMTMTSSGLVTVSSSDFSKGVPEFDNDVILIANYVPVIVARINPSSSK